MRSAVIEIISLLIQKMLHDNSTIMEEEVIEELIEIGYNIKDIDEAFELIYNSTEIIGVENFTEQTTLDELEKIKHYNRVFTVTERLYLPLSLQGLLKKLMYKNILSPRENEEIIIRSIQNSLIGYNSTGHLWDIIEDVVKDEDKLELLSVEINEFKNMISGNYKYIN